MTDNQIDRFQAAAGTGEVLVVTYQGGIAPGHKRRIVISGVNVDADRMSVREGGAVRTYVISKTRLVDESDAAPWMPEDAGKVVAVDPAEYFAGWQYGIGGAHFVALGVFPRYVIDKEKTKLARDSAIAGGLTKAEATKRVKIMRREVVINVPPVYSFEVGDLFYRINGSGPPWAQVMAVDVAPEGAVVEAHWWRGDGRIGYSIPAALFADCLRTGLLPDSKFRIGVSQRPTIMLLPD